MIVVNMFIGILFLIWGIYDLMDEEYGWAVGCFLVAAFNFLVGFGVLS